MRTRRVAAKVETCVGETQMRWWQAKTELVIIKGKNEGGKRIRKREGKWKINIKE